MKEKTLKKSPIFWNLTHINIPDQQQSACFRKSTQKVKMSFSWQNIFTDYSKLCFAVTENVWLDNSQVNICSLFCPYFLLRCTLHTDNLTYLSVL